MPLSFGATHYSYKKTEIYYYLIFIHIINDNENNEMFLSVQKDFIPNTFVLILRHYFSTNCLLYECVLMYDLSITRSTSQPRVCHFVCY